MADTPQVFALSMAKFVEKAKAAPEIVVRKAVLDLASKIITERSPVGDPDLWASDPPPGYVGGRFRANWNVAFGRIDPLTTPSTDKSGLKTRERIRIQLNGWHAPEGAIFLTNSLPYAIPLEYGHSKQAPMGMVRISVAEWNTYVDNAARAEEAK